MTGCWIIEKLKAHCDFLSLACWETLYPNGLHISQFIISDKLPSVNQSFNWGSAVANFFEIGY